MRTKLLLVAFISVIFCSTTFAQNEFAESFREGQSAALANEFDKALEIFEKLEQKQPGNPAVAFFLRLQPARIWQAGRSHQVSQNINQGSAIRSPWFVQHRLCLFTDERKRQGLRIP